MKKRITSLFLVLIMIISLVPSSVFASVDTVGSEGDSYQVSELTMEEDSDEAESYVSETAQTDEALDESAVEAPESESETDADAVEDASGETADDSLDSALVAEEDSASDAVLDVEEDSTSDTVLDEGEDSASDEAEGQDAEEQQTEDTSASENLPGGVVTDAADGTGAQTMSLMMVADEGSAISLYSTGATESTISVSSYKNIYVVIHDGSSDAVYYINSNGVIQNMDGTAASFGAGTYTVYYGPSNSGGGGGRNKTCYVGSVTVEDGDVSNSVTLSKVSYTSYGGSTSSYTAEQYRLATSIYYNSSSFNHIHVRVAGSYVIVVGGKSYTATVSEPRMNVYVDNALSVTHTWSNTTNYEWTYNTNVSRSSKIEVELTLDLTYTDGDGNQVVLDDVVVSYDNINDIHKFIEAIAICDGVEGLDFTVSVEDIEKATEYYQVSYEWKVYNADGSYTELPASAPTEPAATSGHAGGSTYVYDTTYADGYSFTDYSTGLLYTFHGWDTYSHSSVFNVDADTEGYTSLEKVTSITITNNTYIYGYWTVIQLPPASAYIAIEKNFEVDYDGDGIIDAYEMTDAEDLYFLIDTGADMDGDDSTIVEVPYSMIEGAGGSYKLAVYQYNLPMIIEEYGADVVGYTRTTKIEVTGSYAAGVASGDEVSVTLDEVYQGKDVHLGTVVYTNTYTKKIGTPVAEYPSLTIMKSAADTQKFQDGAVFTLYKDADCTEVAGTYTTENNGLTYIDFTGMAAGVYYLKETTAPDGYYVDSFVYKINLTAGNPVEELRNGNYVEVTYYTIEVIVPEDSTTVYRADEANNYFHIHFYNAPILGNVTVEKQISGMDEDAKALLDAVVIVHGPLTRDADGAITDIGETYSISLNEAGDWKAELQELPLGEYLIHESFASVHGYTWTNVTYGDLTTEEYNKITSGVFEITEQNTELALTIENTYEKWQEADISILKVNESNKALAGARFELTDELGNIIAVVETGADGYANIKGLSVSANDTDGVAVYYLEEVWAPDGYYLDNTRYKVEVKAVTSNGVTEYDSTVYVEDNGAWVAANNYNGSTDLLKVTNYPVLGSLVIDKIIDVINYAENLPEGLESVTIYVDGPNGYHQSFVLNESNDWSVEIDGLVLGQYTITEASAQVPGYTLETVYSVGNVTSGVSAVVTLEEDVPGNTKAGVEYSGNAEILNNYTKNTEYFENPTSLQVKKVGEAGEALAGATFTLVRKSDGASVSFTTGANGIVTFNFLRGSINKTSDSYTPIAGEYTLSETAAPEGYVKSDTTWKVTVVEDDGQVRVQLNKDQNVFENIWDWIVGSVTGQDDTFTFAAATEDTPALLTVKNVELADVTLRKTFADADGNAVIPPEGAVIEVALLNKDGELVTSAELTSKNNWVAVIENIPAGTYTITEISASLHGYSWTGASFTVNGITSRSLNNSIELQIEDSAEITVDIANNYTVWETVDFWVYKVMEDGVTPLGGAAFDLYADAALTENVTSKYLDKDVTASNVTGVVGTLHFAGFEVEAGQTATFYLVETASPENYYMNDTVYEIVISHDSAGYDLSINNSGFNHANDTLTVVNEEILGDLVISKTFAEGSDLIPGFVKVDILGPDNYSNTVTLSSAKNWTAEIKDLKLGEYTIKEQDASVNGYDLTVKYDGVQTDRAVVVLDAESDDRPVEVLIENNYIIREGRIDNPASFTVQKVDENGEALAGAVFGLYDADGNLIAEAETGEDGKVSFGGFDKEASYTLKEIAAPEYYQLSEDVWNVEVVLEDGDPTIVLNEEKNIFESIYDWIVGVDHTNWDAGILTLIVPNTRQTGDIAVTKDVTYWLDDTDLEAVPETGYEQDVYTFEIEIYDADGEEFLKETFSLKDGESKVYSDIPYGYTYTVKEIVPEDAAFAVAYMVNIDGTAGVSETEYAEGVSDEMAAQQVDVLVENRYYYSEEQDYIFHAYKVDGETKAALAGAEFALYADEQCTEVVTTAISGEDGKIEMTIPYAEAVYYLKEIKAPAGYYLNEQIYPIYAQIIHELDAEDGATVIKSYLSVESDMEQDENGNYVISNTAIKSVEVTVKKEWVGPKDVKHPKSVEVTLYRDGAVYETVTLSKENNWSYTWSELSEEYTWTVDETKVPELYTKKVEQEGLNFKITNYHHEVPKTGDDSSQILWAGMIMMATAALFVTGTIMRKRRKA